jgi:uncharacterized protein YndB with AHSA1/START domain
MHNRIETRISAPRETVWRIIADFDRYQEWNPFTPQVIGKCAAGEDVRVLVRLEGEPFWMPRRVTKAVPDKHFEWIGTAWYSFMAPGQRALFLENDGMGGTLLIDDEYIGGLSAIMSKSLKATIRQRMVEFGQGLKTAAERGVRQKSA